MRIITGIFTLLFAITVAWAAHAAQDDERLAMIFAKLKGAETDIKAQQLERQIWEIWSERDDAESQSLLKAGSFAMSMRDLESAHEAFSKLVDHDPSFAEAWNKRATVRYLMGDFDGSVLDIEKTLALEPRHFGALSGLGLIFMATGNERAAISSFEKALDINPHMPGPKLYIRDLKEQLKGSPT